MGEGLRREGDLCSGVQVTNVLFLSRGNTSHWSSVAAPRNITGSARFLSSSLEDVGFSSGFRSGKRENVSVVNLHCG